MKFHACHGVTAKERTIGGIFLADITCTFETNAVETDRIEDTLDYSILYDLVKAEMKKSSQTIEHVAGRIMNVIKAKIPFISELVVKISKLNPPVNGEVASASVTIRE